jgi:hypothetical protein
MQILAVTGSNILYCLHSPIQDEDGYDVAMERQLHIECAYVTTTQHSIVYFHTPFYAGCDVVLR